MAMGDATGSNQQGGAYGGGGLQGGYGSGGGENAGGGRGSGGLGYYGGSMADAGGNFGMGINGALGITGGDAGIAANQKAAGQSLVSALRGLGGGFSGIAGDTGISSALADMGLGYTDRAGLVGPIDAIAGNSIQAKVLGALLQGMGFLNPSIGMALNIGDIGQKALSTGFDTNTALQSLGVSSGLLGGISNLGLGNISNTNGAGLGVSGNNGAGFGGVSNGFSNPRLSQFGSVGLNNKYNLF